MTADSPDHAGARRRARAQARASTSASSRSSAASRTYAELGIFSVMWSEHCSYKSSRVHLAQVADRGPARDAGPGRERRRRRHRRRPGRRLQDGEPQPPVLHRALPGRGDRRRRHPARRLHHGRAARSRSWTRCASASPAHPKTRHLVDGVVAGIGGYGNCVGVPTVGGEINFHRGYNGNILVNAMCVGVAARRQDLLRRRRRASATRCSTSAPRPAATASTAPPWPRPSSPTRREAKRPTVQVGDPFTEKLLLEACLELMDHGLHRRHPGHGRRRPDLLVGRDGGARRAPASSSTSTACRCARPA